MDKKVMIFGTFDTVHKGHEFFVREAQKYGNLILVVARDSNVYKFKPRLVHSENERLKTVQKAFPDARCILGEKNDTYGVIKHHRPDIICLGYDQNSFDAGLEAKFPDIKVVRLSAFQPEIYKTSKILP